MGFSSCIWVLWDDSKIDIEVLSIYEQVITIAVKNGDLVKWVFSAIYASPHF